MRAVLQRVQSGSVTVDGDVVGAIDTGFVMLVAVVRGDTAADIQTLVDKTINLRVFADADGRMNHSLLEVGGSILLVSQFTLAADVRKGRRPSFGAAADPVEAESMISSIADRFAESGVPVEQGRFGAMMKVGLVNDGPVTIVIDVVNGAVQ